MTSIKKTNLRIKRRRNFRGLPTRVKGFAPICPDLNDPQTQEAGFRARVLRTNPTPDLKELEQLRAFMYQKIFPQIAKVKPLSFEEWLDTTSYNEKRKDQLRYEYESLRGGRPSLKVASHCKSFGKCEAYPCYKQMRGINSRVDKFKAWSGPYFKAIEQEVYKLRPFIKHCPVKDRPALISGLKKAGRRYFATDYTAFESHFIPLIMDFIECELYRWCLQDNPDDADFICNVLMGQNMMYLRSGMAFKIKGRRMSGDMCTSLGNGFTNYVLTAYLVHALGGELEGFVEGDDGIFSTNVHLTKQLYEKMGWTIKIVEVQDPCKASFCGMVFAESGEIIRDPVRFLASFGWSSAFPNASERVQYELAAAKGLSALYETPQCPIVGAMARWCIAITKGYNPRFVEDGYHTLPRVVEMTDFNPSTDTRNLFFELYGVSVEQQIKIENLIRAGNLDSVHTVLLPHPDMLDYALKYVEVG